MFATRVNAINYIKDSYLYCLLLFSVSDVADTIIIVIIFLTLIFLNYLNNIFGVILNAALAIFNCTYQIFYLDLSLCLRP